jgi:hypothetical protein
MWTIVAGGWEDTTGGGRGGTGKQGTAPGGGGYIGKREGLVRRSKVVRGI